MKTFSSGMLAMLASGGHTLAWGIKITRQDGTVFAFTGHDKDVTLDGVTYLSAPGFDVASFANNAGLAVANNELTIIEDSAAFTKLAVLSGRWDAAEYIPFQYDFKDTANGTIPWPRGKLGVITPNHGSFTVELRDLRDCLNRDTTAIFQPTCRYRFGDSRCTKDATPSTGTVTSVASQYTFSDSSRDEAADWFGNAPLTWTSGDNVGVPPAKVRLYSNGEFTFEVPMVYPIAVGDTYSVPVGCRKRFEEDCRDKHDNVLNFGGEFNKPTTDQVAGQQSPAPPAVNDDVTTPDLPTPGAFNAASRVIGLDYGQTYDAGNVTDLARYSIVVRGMTTNKAATIGASYFASLVGANPDVELCQYVKINELKTPQSSGEDHYTAYQAAVANGWYVLSQPAGTHVQSDPGSGNDEMNITSATTAVGGQHWPEYMAQWEFDNRIDNIPDATWLHCDNVWSRARVTADYACTGTTNQSPSASSSAIIAGNTAWATALRAQRVGIKLLANADNDLSDFAGVFDAALNEGCVGRSYGTFATGGMAAVRARQLSHIANTIQGMAILGSYAESTDYKTHRFAKCIAMLFDSWHCAVDSTPQLHAVWLDESLEDIGVATDEVPSAAETNGLWVRRFETGIVIVNPTSAAINFDQSTFGTYKHFTGTQDATLNDGSTLSGPISIAAMSGLMLLTV